MCSLVTGVRTCALPMLSLIRVPGLVQFSRMAEPSLAEPVWLRAACHGICRRYMDRATGGGNRFTHARHAAAGVCGIVLQDRSEEHTSELQSLMRISYAVFCLKKQKNTNIKN